MEDEELTTHELKAFLQHVVQDLQSSQAQDEGVNPDVLAVVLQNTGFFHKNLEQPANLHDFVQLAKHRLNYEVHPYGSVLMREADYSDKLCIILKGSIQKYQQRSYDELEVELRKKDPKAYKEALLAAQLSDAKETSTSKEKPRYLQHTKSTYKKAAVGNLPNFSNYAKTLNKLTTEANEDQEENDPIMKVVTFAGSKTLNDIDDDDNKSDKSLNDQEWDKDGSDEGAPKDPPTKSMILRRLNTIKPRHLHKKAHLFKKAISKSHVSAGDVDSQEAPADLVIEAKQEPRKKKERRTEGKTEEYSLNEGDVEVLKEVMKHYPDLKGRFFITDIARVKKTRTYKIGDYFGETFYRENRAKEHAITIVNSEELHLLTLGRETYQAIMDELIVNAREKAYFFTDLFPSFEAETVKKFSYHFSEKQFKKNETVYAQNDDAKHIYLLRYGDVKLLKEIEFLPPHGTNKHGEKVELPITNVMKQQFFGEELLLKEGRRHQTAIALSNGTTAYFLGGREYNNIKGNYEDLLNVLKHQSKEKFRWRQQRAVDLLEQRRQNAERAPPITSLKLVDKYKSISDTTIPVVNEYPPKKSDFSRMNSRTKMEINLQSDYTSRLEAPTGFSIKDNRAVMLGSLTAKNKELYQLKFSRRTNLVDKGNIEERLFKKKEDAKAASDNIDSQVKGGVIKFNIRRELSEKKIKVKLPSLTPKASTKLHRVGSETSRGTIAKYAERHAAMMNSAHENTSSKPKSTVLDDLEPHYGGITPTSRAKKGRFADLMQSAEIPSGVYNIIKRVSDHRNGMFSPSSNHGHGPHGSHGSHGSHTGTVEDLKRDEIKGLDDYMMGSNHIKKAPKRMAGGFTGRRKASEDGRNAHQGNSFSIVAKKKEIL